MLSFIELVRDKLLTGFVLFYDDGERRRNEYADEEFEEDESPTSLK